METESKKPVAKGKSGGVDVALWTNKSKKQDGKDYQTLSIQKSYKKQGETEWKTTKLIYASDIENLINALEQLKTEANTKGIKTNKE